MDFEKERHEALMAGNRALRSLEAARQDLTSARRWGFLDILGSRSFLTSVIKQSRMSDAQQHMDQAKYDLEQFRRELNDVNMACDLNINVGTFLSFADVFLDNFFVDWAVQSRINQAAQQVEQAIRMVQDTMDQLSRI